MALSVCRDCILDTSDAFITFDGDGVCNYCHAYRKKEKEVLLNHNGEYFSDIIEEVKKSSHNKYHCIVGISGGLDSSYLLWLTKKAGLNPLAVHYDCGWNSENAVNNIQKLITKLGCDLYTYVVDWEEFRDMQLAYLKAGVIDLEIPTDHSFMAALYKVAAKFGIKYIFTGHNFVTEGVMPRSWVYDKGDAANLRDIHKRFGTMKRLHSFPIMSAPLKFYYYNIRRIKNVPLLNFIDYNKGKAVEELTPNTGWKDHPTKHGESIWTRFYQCYILPTRFGVDKRKAHFSSLICSAQITREHALSMLKQPIYNDELLRADMEFVLKKFRISFVEMERFMAAPVRQHEDFRSDRRLKKWYNALRNFFLFKSLNISHHW